MRYLFGDSTPSSLEGNYIDFLRDVVDFSVQLLSIEQRIVEAQAHAGELEQATLDELERLQKLPQVVAKAFVGVTGAPDSATSRCASAISSSAFELVVAEAAALRSALDGTMAMRDAQLAKEREGCTRALEKLLVAHDWPDATSEIHLALAGGERYVGRYYSRAACGLECVLELEIPLDYPLYRVARVDRLSERLSTEVPEVGWTHKGGKQRRQQLGKLYVSEFSTGAGGGKLELRSGMDGSGSGFDFVFPNAGARVMMARFDPHAGAAEAANPVNEEDAPNLLALYEKLSTVSGALRSERRKLLEAKLDGVPLRANEKPSLLVTRLIAAIAPVVQEISARSQSPHEFVLRRLLGGDRREEIFLSKAELKLKLEVLTPNNRALLDPLWRTTPQDVSEKRGAPPVEPAATTTAHPELSSRAGSKGSKSEGSRAESDGTKSLDVAES